VVGVVVSCVRRSLWQRGGSRGGAAGEGLEAARTVGQLAEKEALATGREEEGGGRGEERRTGSSETGRISEGGDG